MRYVAAIFSFLLGSALLVASFEAPPPRPTVEETEAPDAPGASAPLLLMAFIDMSGPDDSGANRSQALVVRSISDQSDQRRIRVLVVQSASAPGERNTAKQVNVRYDWGLAEMTILPDPDGRLAEAYAIREFPTTLVMSNVGDPIAVWEGYSPPSLLGPALQRIASQVLPPSEALQD